MTRSWKAVRADGRMVISGMFGNTVEEAMAMVDGALKGRPGGRDQMWEQWNTDGRNMVEVTTQVTEIPAGLAKMIAEHEASLLEVETPKEQYATVIRTALATMTPEQKERLLIEALITYAHVRDGEWGDGMESLRSLLEVDEEGKEAPTC